MRGWRKLLAPAMTLAIAFACGNAGAQTQGVGTSNGSGTITTGGTFQVGAAAYYARRGLEFQNLSGNGDACYMHFGADSASTSNSLKISDGNGYLRSSGTIPNDEIQVTCATTGDHYYLVTY